MGKVTDFYAGFREAWQCLPSQLRTCIVVFCSAAGMTILHVLSDETDKGGCFTRECVRHYVVTALGSGLMALRLYLWVPHKADPLPSLPPDVPRQGP